MTECDQPFGQQSATGGFVRLVARGVPSAVGGVLAASLGLLIGALVPGDGNVGHLFLTALCAVFGWLFWLRRGKSILSSVGLCVIILMAAWPVAIALRDATDDVGLRVGQSIRLWLLVLLPPIICLSGILHWLRVRRWPVLVLAFASLGAAIAYTSARSPEMATVDHIEWCGVMVLGNSAEGYSIFVSRERGDDVLGAAYSNLVTLPGLRRARVESRSVTDEGVRLLSKLPRIESLELDSVRLSSYGMECIAQMPRLRRLWLFHVDCGEQEVAALSGSKSLQQLMLTECTISDRAVAKIAAVRTLGLVCFLDTVVSPSAMAELRAKRPDLQIE